MTTMGADKAARDFARLVERVKQDPASLTDDNSDIAVLLLRDDMQGLVEAFLAAPLKQQVTSGQMAPVEALRAQIDLNARLDSNREAIAKGGGVLADDAYFERLRHHAMTRVT